MFGVRSEDQEAKFAHDHMSSWANGVAGSRAMKSCHRLNIGRREQLEMSTVNTVALLALYFHYLDGECSPPYALTCNATEQHERLAY